MLNELLAKVETVQEERINYVSGLLAKHLQDRVTKVFDNTPCCTHCVDLNMLMTADNSSYLGRNVFILLAGVYV